MINSKSIVFVNQSSGYLMIDIINEHVDSYDEIILLTGFLNPRQTPLHPKVVVHYLNRYKRESTLKRLITWMLFSIRSLLLICFKYPSAKLYFVSNPPLVIFIASLLKRSSTFLIYDVYPDALIEYGYLKSKNWIYNIWERTTKRVFLKSSNIFTISEGMRKALINYADTNKVKYIPLWTDNDFLKPLLKQKNNFALKHNIQDSFNIVYSGNLGKTHPVEIMISLAALFMDENINFLIIGEGEKKEKLIRLKEEKKLTNIKILPYQETAVFPLSLAAIDLGVVTLDPKASNLSVPSKTFNLMSTGAIVLGICGTESELNQLITNQQIGKSFPPEDIDEIGNFIKELVHNKKYRENLKNNALTASKRYNRSNAKQLVLN